MRVSPYASIPTPAVLGHIHRRLLINAVIDPDEAAPRLPAGVRPHVTELGTVVGCCLLEIEGIRPSGLPSALGANLRAAAHRFSVEWEDVSGQTVVGVYVPARLTDSRLATMLGGRIFPGVHQPAAISVSNEADQFSWNVGALSSSDKFGIHVIAATPDGSATPASDDEVGTTCIAAAVGLSPNHRGELEAVRMEPAHHYAVPVEITDVESDFLSSFTTASPAPAFLMQDVAVRWTRTPALA